MNQAKIMMLISVCVTYAAGLPLLYLLCLGVLIVNYWYNKYMLFKYCSRQHLYNEKLIINSYSVLRLAFIAHFFVALEMLKNCTTLTHDNLGEKHFVNTVNSTAKPTSSYLEVYSEYLVAAIIMYCVNVFIINPLTCFCLDGRCY